MPCWRHMNEGFFPYRFDKRLALMWLPFGARPGRDGVTVTDEVVRATFGWLKLETPRSNVLGGHTTGPYRWHTKPLPQGEACGGDRSGPRHLV